MADGVKIQAVNADEFNAYLREVQKTAEDLRVPLALIARQEFKFQRATFQLKGPGKYKDLSPSYKEEKKRRLKFVYPILFASGRLALSLLMPGGNNVLRIGKKTLFFGTRVTDPETGEAYPRKHQFGEGVPKRPFFFIDEQRRRNYTRILRDHLVKSFVKKGIR